MNLMAHNSLGARGVPRGLSEKHHPDMKGQVTPTQPAPADPGPEPQGPHRDAYRSPFSSGSGFLRAAAVPGAPGWVAWQHLARIVGERRYRYVVAVVSFLAAAGTQLVLYQMQGTSTPYVPFYAAVVLSALYGGFRPGLVTTVLGALTVEYAWIGARGWVKGETGDWLAWLLFVLSCTAVSLVAEGMHRAWARANAAETDARLAAERERANEALREKQAELKEAQRLAHIGSWYWDAASDSSSGSDELLRIFGFDPATETLPPFQIQRGRCYPAREWERLNAALQEARRTGVGYELDLEAMRGNTPIWVIARGEVVRDGVGRVVGMRGTVQDITERKRVEAELQESKERFELAVRGAGVGIWDWNIQTGKVYFSPRWKALFGFDEHEIGDSFQDWEKLLHPEESQRICRFQADFLAGTGTQVTAEYRLRHKDGSYRWIEAHGIALRDATGKACRLVGSHADVTVRRLAEQALRESERLYRAIGESIDYGVWVCDPSGRNIYASPSFLKLVGQTQKECSDFGWGNVLHPEDAERTIAAWKECVRAGGIWDCEHRFKGVDGKWHPILARGVPVKDDEGNITCWAGINLDISRLKATEEALQAAQSRLQAHSEQLERVVASRTAKLHETISELEHFSYAIAHDLRAPLRAMRGFAELIAEECAGLGPHTGEYVRKISVASARMDQLITDCLNYSRVSREQFTLEPVDLFTLIDGLLATYPNLQPDQAEVRLEPNLPVVLGNTAGLTQCFSNLLGNAVKFAREGERPRIVVRAEGLPAVGAQFVRIWVEDNGIGIPKHAQHRIFGMFERVETHRDGTGIGLAIVRKVVERMGGRVGVESDEGKGSRFWVELERV